MGTQNGEEEPCLKPAGNPEQRQAGAARSFTPKKTKG